MTQQCGENRFLSMGAYKMQSGTVGINVQSNCRVNLPMCKCWLLYNRVQLNTTNTEQLVSQFHVLREIEQRLYEHCQHANMIHRYICYLPTRFACRGITIIHHLRSSKQNQVSPNLWVTMVDQKLIFWHHSVIKIRESDSSRKLFDDSAFLLQMLSCCFLSLLSNKIWFKIIDHNIPNNQSLVECSLQYM